MQLRTYLTDRKITYSEMAGLTGALTADGKPNPSVVHRHATGKRQPDFETIEKYRLATGGLVTASDWADLHKQLARERARSTPTKKGKLENA